MFEERDVSFDFGEGESDLSLLDFFGAQFRVIHSRNGGRIAAWC